MHIKRVFLKMEKRINKKNTPILYYEELEEGDVKYILRLTYYDTKSNMKKSGYVDKIKIEYYKKIFFFVLKSGEIIFFNSNTKFLQYEGCPRLSYLYQYPILLTNAFIDNSIYLRH